jgi:hypothetical protein
MEVGHVFVGDGEDVIGTSTGTVPAPQTGDITVLDNDFSKGRAVLTLGPFEIVSNIHYLPGASTTLTATALAAVISRLPGWAASSVGPVVTAEFVDDTSSEIPFKVLHDDTAEGSVGAGIENLGLNPTTGFLTPGSPTVGPPVIT